MTFINRLQQAKHFAIIYLPLFFIGLIAILATEKTTLFITMNQWNQPVLDSFFVYMNKIGEEPLLAGLLIYFLLKRFGYAAILALVYSITGLTTQFFKKLIFSDIIRPVPYIKEQLGEEVTLNLIEGVKILHGYSFPSGHTTASFAIGIFLALVIKDRRWGIFCALISILGGYARIYLSQHFLEDVLAGSVIGTGIGLLVFHILENKWKDKQWFNKGFLKK